MSSDTRAEGEARVVTPDICSGCGRPLTQRGPNGECLRCLVAFVQDEEAASATTRASTVGSLRYGHFEIAVGPDGQAIELGAGAMAVTYRARDTVLDRPVALKVIDRRVAENATARARFLREARAAAQLHHPNVATVTHYGEQDGECYYAMELIVGETLEARVRRDGRCLRRSRSRSACRWRERSRPRKHAALSIEISSLRTSCSRRESRGAATSWKRSR